VVSSEEQRSCGEAEQTESKNSDSRSMLVRQMERNILASEAQSDQHNRKNVSH
jgi:hypothetical protein